MAKLKEKLVEVWHKWKLTYMESVDIEEIVKKSNYKKDELIFNEDFYDNNKSFFINKEELFYFINDYDFKNIIKKSIEELNKKNNFSGTFIEEIDYLKEDVLTLHLKRLLAIYLAEKDRLSKRNSYSSSEDFIKSLVKILSEESTTLNLMLKEELDNFVSKEIKKVSLCDDEVFLCDDEIYNILLKEVDNNSIITKTYCDNCCYEYDCNETEKEVVEEKIQLELKNHLFYSKEAQLEWLKEEFYTYSYNYCYFYPTINEHNITKTIYKDKYRIFSSYRKELFKFLIKDLSVTTSDNKNIQTIFTYLNLLDLNDGKNIIDKTIDKILTALDNIKKKRDGKVFEKIFLTDHKKGIEKIVTQVIYLSREEVTIKRLFKLVLDLKKENMIDVTDLFYSILAVYNYEKLIVLTEEMNELLSNNKIVELTILELKYSYYKNKENLLSDSFRNYFVKIQTENHMLEFQEWILTERESFKFIKEFYPNLTKDLYVYNLLAQEVNLLESNSLLDTLKYSTFDLIMKNEDEKIDILKGLFGTFKLLKQIVARNINFVEDEYSRDLILKYVESNGVDKAKFNQLKSYLYSKYNEQIKEEWLLSKEVYEEGKELQLPQKIII